MANSKNSFVGSFTDHRTVPYNVTKQGTISTIGKDVKGSYAMAYNTLVGTIGIGNTVTGSTSKAYATVNQDSGTSLNLLNIHGVFTTPEVLTFTDSTGATTATAKVNGAPAYTLFSQQCVVGDYLVSLTQNEVHKITFIADDGSMQIQEAFGTDLTSVAIVISPSIPHPKQISISNTGNANGSIDGTTLPPGVTVNFTEQNQYKNGNDSGFVAPLSCDATGTTFLVQITY